LGGWGWQADLVQALRAGRVRLEDSRSATPVLRLPPPVERAIAVDLRPAGTQSRGVMPWPASTSTVGIVLRIVDASPRNRASSGSSEGATW